MDTTHYTRNAGTSVRATIVTSTTVVATVDAAIATAIVVLVARAAAAPTPTAVAAGAVAFLVMWGMLFLLQRRTLALLRHTSPRFPSPPNQSGRADQSAALTGGRTPTMVAHRPRW